MVAALLLRFIVICAIAFPVTLGVWGIVEQITDPTRRYAALLAIAYLSTESFNFSRLVVGCDFTAKQLLQRLETKPLLRLHACAARRRGL